MGAGKGKDQCGLGRVIERFFFFKQKTAYEITRYWSSDVCSSDLPGDLPVALWQGQMAGALYRALTDRAGTQRHQTGGRGLPRLHQRLPGNAGGNQPGSAREIGRASCRERV